MYKNRCRDNPTFANINFQGPCNYQCFFCLGKDIDCAKKNSYLNVDFRKWKNFDKYLMMCKQANISKIYLTGQNTDPLLYQYLDELISYLKEKKFVVGIRTNGVLALQRKKEIEKLNGNISYSIHTLDKDINYQITKSYQVINLDKIDKEIVKDYRVSIVVTRYNQNEVLDTIKKLSTYSKVRYIQLRCVATDFRYECLEEDILSFQKVCLEIEEKFPLVNEFCSAKIYNIYGKEVILWKTVMTTVNSYNYFTDGVISDNYFVVEGYMKGKNEEEMKK